jgi:hypothetical protein
MLQPYPAALVVEDNVDNDYNKAPIGNADRHRSRIISIVSYLNEL